MSEKKTKPTLSYFSLKLIACITMLIDHIGAVFFPNITLLRIIGRIAMPIYCFMLTEGAVYTRNKPKYLLRLLLSAFISELPFDMLFRSRADFSYQNVMFTLSIGMLCIFLSDSAKKKSGKVPGIILSVVIFALGCAAAEMIGSDYGYIGVLMVASFYFFKGKPVAAAISLIAVNSVVYMIRSNMSGIPLQVFAALALVPIYMYGGKKGGGGRAAKYFFYSFYPAHMIILLAVKLIVG